MKTILLTRLKSDNQADYQYFESRGFSIIEIPLITLEKRAFDQESIKKLKQSEWVFLTSQHAAEFFVELQGTIDLRSKKYAVIGRRTGQILLNHNLSVDFQSPIATKSQLFKTFRARYSSPTSIFYPKSNLADHTGEQELLSAGYTLATPILYENYFSGKSYKELKQCLMEQKITAVYLASPSLWRRFLQVFKEVENQQMPDLYCIGATTENEIKKDGYLLCEK